MTRPSVPTALVDSGLVAILRGGDGRHVEAVAQALIAAGVSCLEITANTTGYAGVVSRLRAEHGGAVELGIGTVRHPEQVLEAVDLGASFVVAPDVNPSVGQAALASGIGWLPGAATPTEIARAWDLDCSAVKVFPAAALGGPSYLAAVRAPLDDIPLVPTGGVDAANARDYMAAGAMAVASGSPLVGDALRTGDISEVARRAGDLLSAVSGGRG